MQATIDLVRVPRTPGKGCLVRLEECHRSAEAHLLTAPVEERILRAREHSRQPTFPNLKATVMYSLPHRAAAAILLAYICATAVSTFSTAASEDFDEFAFRRVVVLVDSPSTSHHYSSKLKIAGDVSDEGKKIDPDAETELEAVYANGLPIPKPFIDKVATNAKFRVEVNATVSASVADVIAFYRRELGKKGWIEDANLSRSDSNKSTFVFHAPEGLGALTITKVRQGTGSDLVLRKTAEAEQSGLLPNNGMATVVIGNSMTEPAAVTINGTTFKLKPGEGIGKPTGPKLNLAPGSYTSWTAIGTRPVVEDSFTVGDGEIWGLLLGPAGNLPIQMY
jgi:hypothetical protein